MPNQNLSISCLLVAPPCYLDIVPEDHRIESPTTPLIDEFDSVCDSPIFMYAPEFKFMPPPTYTEVRIHTEEKLFRSYINCVELLCRQT